MSKVIDSKTWKVMDDHYIVVDDLIADAICVLNSKGYNTKACCSGHYNGDYTKQICDILLLNEEEIKEEYNDFYIEDVTDKDFVFLSTMDGTFVYVMFDKDYKFDKLPEGFECSAAFDKNTDTWSKTECDSIKKYISFYDNGVKKDILDINKEIELANAALFIWAQELDDTIRCNID